MQALQNRLQQLENATGSDIWETFKASEPELRENLSNLRNLQKEKEEKSREALEALKSKREALQNLRKDVESLKNEYKEFINAVESGLKANGLDMQRVVQVYEKVLHDSLFEKRSAILAALSSSDVSTKKSIEQLREPVQTVLNLLEDQNASQLRLLVQKELQEFYDPAAEIFRLNLWNLLQNQGVPMKKVEETSNFPEFLKEIREIFLFSRDLNKLLNGNDEKFIESIISDCFGQLSNLCLDMVDAEKGDADFEWILSSAHKWAGNLKSLVEKTIDNLEIEKKFKAKTGELFNEKFVAFIGTVTKRFVRKNLKDPMIFSKLCALLRKFEDSCDFDLKDKDLFEPLYEPEFMNKWILLEVEMFTVSINELLSDPRCFNPLPAIFIGSSLSPTWASETTVFFEHWLTRVDRDIRSLGNSDAQRAFYEVLHALMLDLCSKINDEANRLYSEPSWSNDVYLVMNTLWELRRILQILTVTWPVSSFEVERAYEEKWERLRGMIGEYLTNIVNNMDRGVRFGYASDKPTLIHETFYHILKCLKNVTIKASKPSRSPLLNVLVEDLFKNLQVKFDNWQNSCSVDILGLFYTHIYSALLPQLDEFHQEKEWTRDNSARSEICRLDALMKMAANRDPSGELVRTAFRSIDEEHIVKMLNELGIHSTSDHAFQDYQILAENWHKIRDKGYGYGDF